MNLNRHLETYINGFRSSLSPFNTPFAFSERGKKEERTWLWLLETLPQSTSPLHYHIHCNSAFCSLTFSQEGFPCVFLHMGVFLLLSAMGYPFVFFLFFYFLFVLFLSLISFSTFFVEPWSPSGHFRPFLSDFSRSQQPLMAA